MIRRFKLEAEGTSPGNCEQQMDDAVDEITALEGTTRDEWEITDFVTWKNKKAKNDNVYCGRIVMKRKERSD
jgi:hypothetical protein